MTGRATGAARRQRGAAALMVVMVLFFVVSLVAAYASRNLIFEQRTSVNQYRSTQAFEAAEAGLEWAMGLLNSGRLTAACQAATDVTLSSFRDRYLSIDPVTGVVTPRTWSLAGVPQILQPSCVRGAAGWVCDCPSAAAPVLAAPGGVGSFPAFSVRFAKSG